MTECTVEIYTHNFVVTKILPRARQAVVAFARQLQVWSTEWRDGRYQRVPTKMFGSRTRDKQEYRFHINQWEEFKETLKRHYVDEKDIEVIEYEVQKGAVVELPIREGWTPLVSRKQPEAIAYALAAKQPHSNVLQQEPGAGKSFCAMYVASVLGRRTIAFMRGGFIKKWLNKDVPKTYDVPKLDIVGIFGQKDLKKLLNQVANDCMHSRMIFISNKTMQEWIRLYEEYGVETLNMGYRCLPHEICTYLDIGFRIIDELHLDFRLNYILDLYTHVPASISLSATLISDDPFIASMQKTAYPLDKRYDPGPPLRYTVATAIIYRFALPNKVKHIDARKFYSHNLFEEYILKHPAILKGYLDVINTGLDYIYFRHAHEGRRALVLCTSIAMCTAVTDYLKKLYPNKDVRRYASTHDPYENLMEAEICVSTLGSAGTGHDISDLLSVLLTIGLSSTSSNIQGFGRLRKIEGVDTQFGYLVAENIVKHMGYYQSKKTALSGRVLKQQAVYVRGQI